ncbi:hypothetical protein [Streptomyces olivaceus]|uniref:hypothetical protein n=1 Tax=Streptomyces olivaceus TaxID=47716 RepID=UPI0022EF8190|nr:hypothetical protein [Streptomyces olivaceus]GHI91732.1 hypothetical protein TPA0905_12030 [Streptomyces olivaceus]
MESQMIRPGPLTAAARWYYQQNLAVWEALRRNEGSTLVLLVAVYLATTAALRRTGHLDAAWAVTVIGGAPLIAAGWTSRS